MIIYLQKSNRVTTFKHYFYKNIVIDGFLMCTHRAFFNNSPDNIVHSLEFRRLHTAKSVIFIACRKMSIIINVTHNRFPFT